jgi:hypothetical protein
MLVQVAKEKYYGLVRLCRIAPGIVPPNQSLYKLEKQSGSELFRPTNPTETNKAYKAQWSCGTSKEISEPFIIHLLPPSSVVLVPPTLSCTRIF